MRPVDTADLKVRTTPEASPQPIEELLHVGWDRRLEADGLSGVRVKEGEPIGMQRLSREANRSQRVGTGNVAALADERVPMQAGLKTDLVLPSRNQPDFDERRPLQPLDDAILARSEERRVGKECRL